MSLQDGVVVTGTGQASGATDVVQVSLGCEARADGVSAALDGVVRALAAMRAALVAGGVGEADVLVEDTSVRWEQDYQTQRVSYVATAGLSATVRDPSAAGRLVSAAVGAGGDAARLHGLRRTLDRPETLLPQAREAAMADARAKAEHYAALAGLSLGRVLAVAEPDTGQAVPLAEVQAARMAAPADLPYEVGTAAVSAVVRVRWELL